MNTRSILTLSRIAGHFVLGIAMVLTFSSAAVTADEFSTTCNYDELCGWVQSTTEANLSEPDTVKSGGPVGNSITAIVAAVASSKGVSLQQFVEPFAMVGPEVEDASRMIREFDRWWKSMVEFGKTLSSASMDQAINDIANLEPIDVNSIDLDVHGPSVLERPEDVADATEQPTQGIELGIELGIEVTRLDSLVGSAPMIATINVPYLPYDLSASDLRLRSVFPFTTQAFCVRSRVAQWNPVPMWTEVDQFQAEPQQPESAVGPVDCWMEELISKVDDWSGPQSPVWTWATPNQIGVQLANVAAQRNLLVSKATQIIAAHWPEPIAPPSPIGLALLIRADAVVEATSPEPAARVAEATSESIVR